MSLNTKVLATTGLSVGALFIVLANNTKTFVEGLQAVPALIKLLAEVLPLGTGSMLVSMLVAGGVYYWIERVAPAHIDTRTRDLGAEFAALLVSIAMTVGQVALVGAADANGKPYVWLVAASLGFVGGTVAPFLAKCLLAAKPVDKPLPAPDASAVFSKGKGDGR